MPYDYQDTKHARRRRFWGAVAFGIPALVLAALFLWGYPEWKVYNQQRSGEAKLREAQFTRQIAALDAQAEIERAKGAAEANRILGESLRNNEPYLRYLWIMALNQNERTSTVYVATEAGLPILEATRLSVQRE